VNREPLHGATAAPLSDGDIVRIGDSFLLLRFDKSKPPDAQIPSLIGAAPAMAELRHRIARIATDPATVLILGETGTGKEVVATALHELSRRSGARIAVNCSAIPENLAESQFFGHTANAFTGAKAHAGFFPRRPPWHAVSRRSR
jgi:DNA-binding NtrC family response regulator